MYTPLYLRQVANGQFADLVVICTGATSAIAQALQSVECGGTVLFFAPTDPGITIPVSVNPLLVQRDNLTSSYAGSPADYATALELIHVQDMITHRLSLAETGLGFQLVAQAQDSIKVIIEPQQ